MEQRPGGPSPPKAEEQRPMTAKPSPMPMGEPAMGGSRGRAAAGEPMRKSKTRRGFLVGALLIGALAVGAGAIGTGLVNVPGFNPASTATQTEQQTEQMSDISGQHYIGLTMQTLTPAAIKSLNLQTSRSEGVVITRIWHAGPAEAAGLHVNDIIIAVDGVPVRSMNEVGTKTRLTEIGDRYQVTVERNGVVQSIPVRVEKWMGRTAPCTLSCGG
jgi:PDZ domain-containing secreted protein